MVAKRPLLFRRTYPFQIQVSPPYTDPETHEGQMVARPRLPGWFLGSMLLLLGTGCWGFLWLNTLLSLLYFECVRPKFGQTRGAAPTMR
jgi:hypothetical protein